MKKSIIFIIALHASLFTLHVTEAQIIHVPADQPTIQAGIDAANDGDTVLVDEGTYLENINFLGKAITVASHFIVDADTNHISNTIIDGSQPDDPDYGSVVTFITGEDTTSVICGFTITGGAGTLFPMDQARAGGGILCYNAGATVKSNIIISNQVDNAGSSFGGGVAMNSDGSDRYVILEDNRIKNNILLSEDNYAYGGGIYSTINTTIIENLITGNSIISHNAMGGGITSFSLYGINQVILENNVINNNTIEGNDVWGGGVAVQFSAAIITGNQINNNAVTSVRAWGGGLMTQGTIGEFHMTDNEIAGNSISASNYGVGMGASIHSSTANTYISGNVFSNNTATGTSYGGGFRLNNSNGVDILVDGNVISDNNIPGAGGGVYTNASNCRFVNNLVANNSAGQSGGGIFMEIDQKDDLFYNSFPGSLTQDLNLVRDISGVTDFIYINNTFTGNSAGYYGGAIRVNYTTETCLIMNSVFWENNAVLGDDIHYSGSDTIRVYYSDVNPENIFGTWTGEGNINADPEFIDDLCHIDEFSPCVDMGADSLEFNGTWYYAPGHDFDGDIRPYGSGGIDIGADENDIFTAIDEFKIQHSTFNIQTYPNPTSGISHFAIYISQYQYVSLKIYDLHGREVAVVLDEMLPAGEHVVKYDMTGLPAGVYFVELRAKGIGLRAVSKLVVL